MVKIIGWGGEGEVPTHKIHQIRGEIKTGLASWENIDDSGDIKQYYEGMLAGTET